MTTFTLEDTGISVAYRAVPGYGWHITINDPAKIDFFWTGSVFNSPDVLVDRLFVGYDCLYCALFAALSTALPDEPAENIDYMLAVAGHHDLCN